MVCRCTCEAAAVVARECGRYSFFQIVRSLTTGPANIVFLDKHPQVKVEEFWTKLAFRVMHMLDVKPTTCFRHAVFPPYE